MFTAPLPHDEAAETASFRKAFASAMQKADPVCSPPVVKTALVSGDSGAALVGGTTRKSNFDLTGAKLVKRGALVSWHGIRFTVSRVRMGWCYPTARVTALITPTDFFECNSVQVVA